MSRRWRDLTRARLLLVPALVLATLAGVAPAALPQGTVGSLTLREKVGQLVMFGIHGPRLSERERTAIKRNHFGGVILFARNYRNRAQLERLTGRIQAAARRGNSLRAGALISVDQEGGVVKRFPDMPPDYSAPRMGEIGKSSLAFDQGRATARALKRAGVNMNLAPVADLDLPPEHVMRSRSFGRKPRRVGRLVNAFSRGLQSRRVGATAKHFPGLGGATVNSDFGRAYVRRSRRQLRNVDAVPFRRAIRGGLRAIMVSHGIYVNDGGRRPASITRSIATRRLRQGFGFEGVAISDALEPIAWKFDGVTSKACKATIKAGVDIALITRYAGAARDCARRIGNGVRNGEIPQRRLDQAVTRVLELKAWLGLLDPA